MLLKEGGAAGHMVHPFDLPDVKTGEDLKDFFDQAADSVKKSQAVKIDGVNVSFKLISDEKDRKEFAVDRGSTKPIDIEGVSIDRVGERFPKVGHGMRVAIKTLLSIFNEALPKIEPELKKLGMWDNPTVFLNTEYVAETTNVTEYDHNFLAIHSVNQFYEKTNSRTGVERRGLERPTVWDPDKEKEVPIKDPSVEISYDPKVLQRLTDKVEPFAKKYDFEIYTTVPTSFKEEAEINFSDTLKEPFTVVFSEEDEVTQSLEDWLKEVDNPRHKFIKKVDGKKIGALSKEVYTNILDGKPITSFISEEEDVKPAIAGAIFYHATRMLGNDILRALTSPMGDVTDHEGVVIRHKKFGQKPVKITGDFILGGMSTGFRESKEHDENFINEVLDVFLEGLEQEKYVILIPGGFKPPHKGHKDMIQYYADQDDVEKVIVISGTSEKAEREGVNREMSMRIFKDLYGLDNPKIEFMNSGDTSPMALAYQLLGDDYFSRYHQGATIAIGCSDKKNDKGVSDFKRAVDFAEWIDKDGEKQQDARNTMELYDVKVGVYPACVASSAGEVNLSGTDLRRALMDGDDEAVRTQLPDGVNIEDFKAIINIGDNLEENALMTESAAAIVLVDILVWMFYQVAEESFKNTLASIIKKLKESKSVLSAKRSVAQLLFTHYLEGGISLGKKIDNAFVNLKPNEESLKIEDYRNKVLNLIKISDNPLNLDVNALPEEEETGSLNEIIYEIIGEVLEEKDCFSHKNYKTFKGKAGCVKNKKGVSQKSANAITAKVLRDKGEIKEKAEGAEPSRFNPKDVREESPCAADESRCTNGKCKKDCGETRGLPTSAIGSINLEEEELEEISGAGAAGGFSLPLGQKPKYFNSPRPKLKGAIKGIKIYTRRSKSN